MTNNLINQAIISPWIYQGKDIQDVDIPERAEFFLYKINHIETGKWYIGRKKLTSIKYKQVKGKKKKINIDSDWKNYWSSSEELQAWVKIEGEDKFKREILLFTETASQILYLEECILYHTNALLDDNCLNSNIRAKIFKKWFEDKKNNNFKKDLVKLKLNLS